MKDVSRVDVACFTCRVHIPYGRLNWLSRFVSFWLVYTVLSHLFCCWCLSYVFSIKTVPVMLLRVVFFWTYESSGDSCEIKSTSEWVTYFLILLFVSKLSHYYYCSFNQVMWFYWIMFLFAIFLAAECPPSEDGTDRFACPSADSLGRYRCIADHSLCDGFLDCPKGEDEDRQSCMFYKTVSIQLFSYTCLFCIWQVWNKTKDQDNRFHSRNSCSKTTLFVDLSFFDDLFIFIYSTHSFSRRRC